MPVIDDLYSCVAEKCQQRQYGESRDTVAKLFMPATFAALEFKTHSGKSVHAEYKDYQSWRTKSSDADMRRALTAYYQQEHANLLRIAKRDAVLKSALAHIDDEDLGLMLVEKGLSKTIHTLKARPAPKPDTRQQAQQQEQVKFQAEPVTQDSCEEQTVIPLQSEQTKPAVAPVVQAETAPESDPAAAEAKKYKDYLQKYTKDHPANKFSGVLGVFGSQYKPMVTVADEANPATPAPIATLSETPVRGVMPLANVQYVRTLKDDSDLNQVYIHGDHARKTTELGIAGSWRFHWGYEDPLLLTPRRFAITQNIPQFKTINYLGNSKTELLGSWSVSAGLIANDPLLTSTRPMIYPNSKPVGDCGCIGGFQDVKMGEVQAEAESCELPLKPVLRKPETTLLAFNADSGEFGVTGIGAGWNSQKLKIYASYSPKGLPKFKPSVWNEMPQPITNVDAGTILATYKPRDNLLLGVQASKFGKENRLSLIGRTYWPNGTNAGLALDYGIMPNRTNGAALEPMGLARGVLEVPVSKSLDIGVLTSAGRYFDTDKNFFGTQLSVTYRPAPLKFALNFAGGYDTRYDQSFNIGAVWNIK